MFDEYAAEMVQLAGDYDYGRILVGQLTDALLAIVGAPWRRIEGPLGDDYHCPGCQYALGGLWSPEHDDQCPWMVAARALGIA